MPSPDLSLAGLHLTSAQGECHGSKTARFLTAVLGALPSALTSPRCFLRSCAPTRYNFALAKRSRVARGDLIHPSTCFCDLCCVAALQNTPVRVGIKATHSLQHILSSLLTTEADAIPPSRQRFAARCDPAVPWSSQVTNALDDPRLAPFNPAPVHPAMLPSLAGSPAPLQRLGSSPGGLLPSGLFPSPYIYSNLPPPRVSRSLLRAYRPFPPQCPPAFGGSYTAAGGSFGSRLNTEGSACGLQGGGRAAPGRVPAPPRDVGATPQGALGSAYDVSWGAPCGSAVLPFWTPAATSPGFGGPHVARGPQFRTGVEERSNGAYPFSESVVGTEAVEPSEESEQAVAAAEPAAPGAKTINRTGKCREAAHFAGSEDSVQTLSFSGGDGFFPFADTSTFSVSCPVFVPPARNRCRGDLCLIPQGRIPENGKSKAFRAVITTPTWTSLIRARFTDN